MKKISMKTRIKTSKLLVAAMICLINVLVLTVPVKAAKSVVISNVPTTANVGDTFTATFSVPSDMNAVMDITYSSNLTFVSTSEPVYSGGGGTLRLALDTNSATVTFRTNAAGDATISVDASDHYPENTLDNKAASVRFTIANQATGGTGTGGEAAAGSADNSLSSLTLSAGTLSPAFQYSTTKYTATVPNSVTSVVVSAKTSNANATIESVTGGENLAVGANTISIVVKAENGVTVTYTIVVTREAAEETADQPETPDETTPEPEPDSESVDGIFDLNGTTVQAAQTIPDGVIPADFALSTITLGSTEFSCATFEKGNLTLLYLMDGEEGSFGVYDAARNLVYPFVVLSNETHYVIVLNPEENLIPEGYSAIPITIEGKGVVTAYQKDITGEQGTESAGSTDFYLIYCANDSGEFGWYQYDSLEGTYQRVLSVASSEESVSTETESDLQSQNASLSEELEQQRNRYRYLMFGTIFGVAVLLIVIINLIIWRKRDDDGDDDGGDDENEDGGDSLEEEPDEDFHVDANLAMGSAAGGVLDQENSDDVEVEFYNMEDEPDADMTKVSAEEEDSDVEVEFYEMEEKKETVEEEPEADSDDVEVEFYEMDKAESDGESDEDTEEVEVEFYNMDEAKADESKTKESKAGKPVTLKKEHDSVDIQFREAEEELKKKYGTENIRVTKRSLMGKLVESKEEAGALDKDFGDSKESDSKERRQNKEADLNKDGVLDEEEFLSATIREMQEKAARELAAREEKKAKRRHRRNQNVDPDENLSKDLVNDSAKDSVKDSVKDVVKDSAKELEKGLEPEPETEISSRREEDDDDLEFLDI